MKLVWLLLVAVVIINVSNAESIIENVTEMQVNKSAITKMSPNSDITTRRPNGSIFLNMPDRRKKFVVNLKPATKTEPPTTRSQNYSNRLMKKLQIKHVNYYDKAKVPAEITTRRSLMKIRKFTVKPHHVYTESVREKHNWNGNKKISDNNLRKPKSERYTEKNIKPSNEEVSSEQRFSNFKNVDSSINDNDSGEFGKEEKQNSYVAAGSQKFKTVFFPKKNNRKYLKLDPAQKTSERKQENISISENRISSDVVNNPNGDITEDKEKSTITNKLFIKSAPKDNFSDQGKADRSEFMFIGVKQKDISLVPAFDEVEMSTDSDLDFIVI